MSKKPGTSIDLIRRLRNRRNILTKIQLELVGSEEECTQIIKEYAALRGDRPWWADGRYAYGHASVHHRESTVVFWGVR